MTYVKHVEVLPKEDRLLKILVYTLDIPCMSRTVSSGLSSRMVLTILLLILLVFLALAFYIRRVTKWEKPPPGPAIHPFLGNFPTMAKLDPVPHKAWHSLTLQFGPMVRLVMGLNNMLVIGGYEDMKEAMNNELLDDRGPSPTANLVLFGSETVDEISLFARGKLPKDAKLNPVEKWREIRRFILRSLRDLGAGKSGSEEAIIEESKALIKNITEAVDGTNGEINLEKTLNCAALNIVWNLVAGERFSYDDPLMRQLVDFSGNFMLMGKDVIGKPFGFMPFLRFIPPFKEKFNKLSSSLIKFKEYINSEIDKHKESFDKENQRDLMDMFIAKMDEDTHGIFTQTQLIYICLDLFNAGSESTSKSLLFAIALMMRYPEIQDKVHDDLDKIDADCVTMKDRTKIPYVEATLNEIWRFCNVAPFGPPRQAYKDTPLKSTIIPAGTLVMYNTYSLHMDEAHWGDPEVFRPERFLDDYGAFRSDEMNLPFGIGRRKCLGESLARMENFLFLSNIFQNFKFVQIGDSPPSLEPEVGFTNGPYPFTTKIVIRNRNN